MICRPVPAALAAALCAVVLSGCTAEVDTTVEVTGASEATITVSAEFTGEAGQVVASNTAARTGIVDLFAARTGERPDVEVDGDTVRVSTDVTYDTLANLTDLTGVREVGLTRDGTETVVTYGPATRLRDTVTRQNAGEPDADALTATMLESTQLRVSVVYAGGVDDATADGGEVVVDGRRATLSRTAADTDTGTFRVTGDRTGDRWPWLLGGAAAAAAAGWWFRRR